MYVYVRMFVTNFFGTLFRITLNGHIQVKLFTCIKNRWKYNNFMNVSCYSFLDRQYLAFRINLKILLLTKKCETKNRQEIYINIILYIIQMWIHRRAVCEVEGVKFINQNTWGHLLTAVACHFNNSLTAENLKILRHADDIGIYWILITYLPVNIPNDYQ